MLQARFRAWDSVLNAARHQAEAPHSPRGSSQARSWRGCFPALYDAWFREGNVLVDDVRHSAHLMHPLLDRLFEERHGVAAGIGTWKELKGAHEEQHRLY